MDEAGLQMTFSFAPVLTYLNIRSAPVLEEHNFRRGLIHFWKVSEREGARHA